MLTGGRRRRGKGRRVLSYGGRRRVALTVKNPYFEDQEACYGILADGETAVIEMAAAAGLPLVGERLHPEQTTTYGVGRLVADVVTQRLVPD